MGSMPRLISLGILLTLIVVLGGTFYRVMAPFLTPLFLAAMTAIVSKPMFNYFLRQNPNRTSMAAGMTTAVLLAAILIPLATITTLASLQLYSFASATDLKSVEHWISTGVEIANQYLPKEGQLTAQKATKDLAKWISSAFQQIGDRSLGSAAGATLGTISGIAAFLGAVGISLLIYGMAIYYFLADGDRLLRSAQSLIPVDETHQLELYEEFSKVVQGVVVATFAAAIGQGVATTAALWFFGFHNLFALGALATLSALVPMLGTCLVWIPCAIWMFTQGQVTQGVIFVSYCLLFVGFIDNIIRTYVLNTNVKLHPLLAFISVLGGIQALGLWGVFIGPIVASCLYALVKVFNTELDQLFAAKRDSQIPLAEDNKDIPEVIAAPAASVMPPG